MAELKESQAAFERRKLGATHEVGTQHTQFTLFRVLILYGEFCAGFARTHLGTAVGSRLQYYQTSEETTSSGWWVYPDKENDQHGLPARYPSERQPGRRAAAAP